MLKSIFNYISPIWSGEDNKPSIRRVLAIAFSIDFIISIHHCVEIGCRVINLIYLNKVIDAAVVASMSSNLAQIVLMLGTEAALIAALLGLTTLQNMKSGFGTKTQTANTDPS